MVKIGLLEDNSRIARLCATMLQYAGHKVTVYEHPRTCLDALLPSAMVPGGNNTPHSPTSLGGKPTYSHTFPIDVLMLDLHLPEITGFEVLHLLRNNAQTQHLPLIFCTAATPNEIKRAMYIAPEAIFVEKPFTYQELIDAINQLALAYDLS